MRIAKHRITEALRERGQHIRADWVEFELPDWVESDKHTGLLKTLHLDPADLAETSSP
ncbi:hypothetical protein [Micromonospora sp. NPDC023956]|uniref:hypothetical protein n=1 Tax=Micromonospora sp. NPDC023956 TaxID=3155722 RepID=UPI0033DB720D